MGSTRRKPSLAAAAAWLASLVRRPLLFAGLLLALVVLVVMAPHLLGGRLLVLDDIWTSDLLNNNAPPRAFLGDGRWWSGRGWRWRRRNLGFCDSGKAKKRYTTAE